MSTLLNYPAEQLLVGSLGRNQLGAREIGKLTALVAELGLNQLRIVLYPTMLTIWTMEKKMETTGIIGRMPTLSQLCSQHTSSLEVGCLATDELAVVVLPHILLGESLVLRMLCGPD